MWVSFPDWLELLQISLFLSMCMEWAEWGLGMWLSKNRTRQAPSGNNTLTLGLAIATPNHQETFPSWPHLERVGRIHDVRKGLHMHWALPRLQLLGISAPRHVTGRLQLRAVSAQMVRAEGGHRLGLHGRVLHGGPLVTMLTVFTSWYGINFKIFSRFYHGYFWSLWGKFVLVRVTKQFRF